MVAMAWVPIIMMTIEVVTASSFMVVAMMVM
eukprot:CAMPEP_0178828092 /NCGR_PEP_ID=MMETSP0746-20121128/7640_1 /TAXON_ID=913974 /ORGANISM="Nitzschia punctata, Strain CCMP561" /LENGTH=30 /DNA_ID= /DNA_START= /DNA_END= /DNA_ORIENTATION=